MPKPSRPRPKLSFAVDRAEIDISSEWVPQVVQQPPTAPPVPAAEPVLNTLARPIKTFEQALTSSELAFYSALYGQGDGQPDGSRLARAGYRKVCELTGMSKRNVQIVRKRLEQKHAITIEQAPGFTRTETTAYRVYPKEAILRKWHTLGLTHVRGKGKLLVKQ